MVYLHTYVHAFVHTSLTNILKNIDLEMGSTSYVRTKVRTYIYSDDIETKENCNYGTSCTYVRIRYHTVAVKRIKSLIKQKYTYLRSFTYVRSHEHQHKQTAKRRFPELSRKFDQEL